MVEGSFLITRGSNPQITNPVDWCLPPPKIYIYIYIKMLGFYSRPDSWNPGSHSFSKTRTPGCLMVRVDQVDFCGGPGKRRTKLIGAMRTQITPWCQSMFVVGMWGRPPGSASFRLQTNRPSSRQLTRRMCVGVSQNSIPSPQDGGFPLGFPSNINQKPQLIPQPIDPNTQEVCEARLHVPKVSRGEGADCAGN